MVVEVEVEVRGEKAQRLRRSVDRCSGAWLWVRQVWYSIEVPSLG